MDARAQPQLSPRGFMLKSSSCKFCGRHRPLWRIWSPWRPRAGQRLSPKCTFPTDDRPNASPSTRCSPRLYLQGGLPLEACGKLAQAFGSQVIGGQIQEHQAGHGAQGGQQLGGTSVPQPVPCQVQLPERCVKLEGPQQRGELGLTQGQGAHAERGAGALAVHGLQHLWVLLWAGREGVSPAPESTALPWESWGPHQTSL